LWATEAVVEGQVSRFTIIIILIGRRWTVVIVIFVIVFVVGQRWTVVIVIFVIVFVVGSQEAGLVLRIIGQRCATVIVIFIIVVVVVAAWGTHFIGSTVGLWKNDDSKVAGPVQPGFSTGDSGAVGDTNGGPIVSDECRRGLQFQFPVTRGGTCDGISGTGVCIIGTNRAGRERWPSQLICGRCTESRQQPDV
jgi:hypothetical protein